MLSHKMLFPVEMPWNARTVPHATIEVNQKCNIDYHGCYKIENNCKFAGVSQTKKYGACKYCPDATIRNGQLLPVCIAAHISPLAMKPKEEKNVRHSIV